MEVDEGGREIHWALIRTDANLPPWVPFVVYGSHPSISVLEWGTGRYKVTFPSNFKVLACTATLSYFPGIITAVPGHAAGLGDNEVRILTQLIDGRVSPLDFTVVAYSKRGAN